MVKKMKLLVLMAGRYDIVKGAKIRFYLDVEKNLYIASCGRKDFGIVKFLKDGNKKTLRCLVQSLAALYCVRTLTSI